MTRAKLGVCLWIGTMLAVPRFWSAQQAAARDQQAGQPEEKEQKSKKSKKGGKKGGKKAGTAKKAQPEAAAPGEPAEEAAGSGFRFVFRDRPSLRAGRWLRLDFRFKTQSDVRGYDPEVFTEEGTYELHRGRVGIEGRFLRHFEFEVEREMKEQFSDLFRIQKETSSAVWRDAFVNFRYFRDAQIKVGKFKIPFSLDQNTGTMNLDFPYRSRLAVHLAPARDQGIMLHGRVLRRGLNYEAGIFRNDGENADFTQVVDELGTEERFKSGLRTFAGRITGTPLRLLPVPAVLKEVEVGGAFTESRMAPGLKGLRGRATAGETIFRHIFVHGQRLRLGAQMKWTPGPFSLKSEFVHVQDERRGQGLRGEDLSDLISRGWYVSGTWVITGQKNVERDEPKKSFPFRRGIGAVEAAGRYEAIRFGSAEHPGRPSRTSRAANILGNSDRAWTVGVNWYLNHYMKIQLNGIRENIEDVQRTPIPGRNIFWTRLLRIQFVM